MQHVLGIDLFTGFRDADAICLTTNGFIKRSGAAVMGAGVARSALDYWPGIDYLVARSIGSGGCMPQVLTIKGDWDEPVLRVFPDKSYSVEWHIVTFPVKPNKVIVSEDKSNIIPRQRDRFEEGDECPGFWAMADLDIIEHSAKVLHHYASLWSWEKVIIPAPGTGNGGLTEAEVFARIGPILDDRFWICTK